MANEELDQRGYLASGKLKGTPFGGFEELNIGSTSVRELLRVGIAAVIPKRITFPFKHFKPAKKPEAAKPDRVFLLRQGDRLVPMAVAEQKAAAKMRDGADTSRAAEQALFSAMALGAPVAITTNNRRYFYIDVLQSAKAKEIRFHRETRDLNPAVLQNLLAGDADVARDPKPLAESVWQTIWHATKEEPKQCLLTFVEIFVLKFLSDNLPKSVLPDAYSFYTLLKDPADFRQAHGCTAIEYYVSTIRPQIKKLFPDNVVVQDEELPRLFGLSTLVSKTSVINGFAFLKSSEQTVAGFNRTFLDILDSFDAFGPLTAIDPEFKLRLYETFLKRSARQQKLGQFFTPRNVVRQMIRMARLGRLPTGSVVLDPAAGVGGFVLEPMLIENSLPDNVRFERGRLKRKVKTIGIDVDANTHILAKANMLIHLAEAVRNPATTLAALNTAMAETFVLMNSNETLGALENPPREAVDVILTNPPYVTQGSRVYKEEIASIEGMRNGLDLRDYYDRAGLGLESLFLRYISGALKPGGRAFVIVPHGMLNRTEPGPKAKLLEECNLIASISLPRNTFFNTPQTTYILAFERRHTAADPRPEVFCSIVRTIGESLDHDRVPAEDNDLRDITDAFVAYSEGNRRLAEASPLVKLAAPEDFGPDDRWDVQRLWTQEELVSLGQVSPPVDRISFIDDIKGDIDDIVRELQAARVELAKVTSGPTKPVALNDATLFAVRSGIRIRNEDIRDNPGDVPVYSCFTDPKLRKGSISEKWLRGHEVPIETGKLVTIMANGAKAIGKVFIRDERCVFTDDVIIVEPLVPDLDKDYVASQLRSVIARGNYVYEAKLFVGRVRQLTIEVPVTSAGQFDLSQQRVIAGAIKRFDEIRAKLRELGEESASVRVY